MALPMANKKLTHWGKRRHLVQFLVVALFFLSPIPIPGVPGFEKGLIKLDFNVWNIHFLGWVLPKEHFYLFFIAIIVFLIVLVVSAFSLGKVFCGYICPQNIYYEFLHRIHAKLKKRFPWYRRSPKIQWATDLALTLLFASATVYTLNHYFIGANLLFHLWISFLSFTLFVTLVHILKHKFCTNACPIHYCQKSLQTRTTMHIAYDADRPGKPCDKCFACYRACYVDIDPTKDRYHHDCTMCGACVDACSRVYRNKDEPSLLKFSFEEEGKEGQKDPRKLLKIFLAGVVVAACVGYVGLFNSRSMDKIQLSRSTVIEEQQAPDINRFQLKVKNLRPVSKSYRLNLETESFRFEDGTRTVLFELDPHTSTKKMLVIRYEGDSESMGTFIPMHLGLYDPDSGNEIKRFKLHFMARSPGGARK